MTFDPAKAQNNEDIELHWAIKAIQHSQTYFKLLTSIPHEKIKLTKYDEELYSEFRKSFPDLNIATVNEQEFTSEANKQKWRDLIQNFEEKIQDFNFGTLLRLNAEGEYSEENSFFVTRVQFFCVEIARLREGLNSKIFGMKVEVDEIETQELDNELKVLQDRIVQNLQ
jgi:hypothetical protein